jgi:deoxyribodipyrimidine photo-lyase
LRTFVEQNVVNASRGAGEMKQKGGEKIGLVWLRNDLRLHDNETLTRVVAENDVVVPVYVFDTRNYRTSTYGFKKTGDYRLQFVLECVADMRQNLRAIGGELVIKTGIPEDILPALCELYGATTVYLSQEVAPEETKVEAELQQWLQSRGVGMKTYNTATLLTKERLPFGVDRMPDMFTAFRWEVERVHAIQDVLQAPTHIAVPVGMDAGELPDVAALNGAPVTIDPRAAIRHVGGETAALARLQEYVWETDGVATYFDTRNGLVGKDYSTKLSAWLSTGCISARMIHHTVKAYERERVANKSTYWVTFELLWRDFFRFNMEKYHCELFFSQGPKRKTKDHTDNYELLHRWINGETGSDFVDANMNELRLTGFMSNRGRQITASYLVNDLKVKWLMGAAYFESLLIDYDVCSNYGNWAYIAGVGNDPRQDRYFNIDKQAATYDADGAYRRLWLQKQ